MMRTDAPADRLAATEWEVWTTTARVAVTDPASLPAAVDIVRAYLDRVDAVASRFRADSEVSRLATAVGSQVTLSPLLRELVAAALHAAQASDGDVDPTLGSVMTRLGYGSDLRTGPGTRRAAPLVALERRASWRDLRLEGTTLELPQGTTLDLGATAKAYAADRCAVQAADELGCGVLVSLGGDIRVAGPEPGSGWLLLVQDGPGEPSSTVRLTGARAMATSSTMRRRWRHDGQVLHHVLDPLTGRPADPVWRSATVAAPTCLEANTWSTAALVRGRRAPALLRRVGLDARLVAADGTVVSFGGWPT
jgi:thiamine biosynthesis lipoprotein